VQRCFWRRDDFQEFGIFVLRFFKDCNVIYIIIDDRIPVKRKDGRVIFASAKESDELWVPLVEKAYAKLHGSYGALVGGFTHYGLADMTGYCPRLIVIKPGFMGYSEKYDEEDIWRLLLRYKSWNSLMGCSIQPNPKETNKVEADAGGGLHMGHAYSLLDLGEIKCKHPIYSEKNGLVRLLKLRNPWGRGEWEGPFSDSSKERENEENDIEIKKVFEKENTHENIDVDSNDGTFFIPFKDWFKRFTSIFIAINFPSGINSNKNNDNKGQNNNSNNNSKSNSRWTGKRVQGNWTGN
jgi:hypothetical protein